MKRKVVILIHAETDLDIGEIDNRQWKEALSIEGIDIRNVQISVERAKVKGKPRKGSRSGAVFGKTRGIY